MPDPARTRGAPKSNKGERTTAADPRLTGPTWARALHYFYDPSFDIRSSAGFQAALNDFVLLPPDEQAFHQTHLLYRAVQGLESIHGLLSRVEAKLSQAAAPDLSALKHLEPIRAALEEIASGQPDLVAVDELEGDEEEDQDELNGEAEEAPPEDDPDFIYDTIPEDEPRQPRRPGRAPPAEAPRAEPDREALVGDLVPATEGPQGDGAGDR